MNSLWTVPTNIRLFVSHLVDVWKETNKRLNRLSVLEMTLAWPHVWKPRGVLYLPYCYAELACWTREMGQLLWTLTSSIHALNSKVSKQPEMGSVVTDRDTTRGTRRFHHSNISTLLHQGKNLLYLPKILFFFISICWKINLHISMVVFQL